MLPSFPSTPNDMRKLCIFQSFAKYLWYLHNTVAVVSLWLSAGVNLLFFFFLCCFRTNNTGSPHLPPKRIGEQSYTHTHSCTASPPCLRCTPPPTVHRVNSFTIPSASTALWHIEVDDEKQNTSTAVNSFGRSVFPLFILVFHWNFSSTYHLASWFDGTIIH